jgi:hypothetical protein
MPNIFNWLVLAEPETDFSPIRAPRGGSERPTTATKKPLQYQHFTLGIPSDKPDIAR